MDAPLQQMARTRIASLSARQRWLVAAGMVTVLGFAGADRWFYEVVAQRLHTASETDLDFYSVTNPFWHFVRFFPHLIGGLLAYFAVLAFHRMGLTYANAALLTVLPAAFAANLAQDTLGRYRPNQAESHLAFAPPFAGLQALASGGSEPVGFPSGEAATSLALALVLSRCFPRGRVVFYTVAGLVCLERCLHGKHYLSDVAVGAALGYYLAWLLWPRMLQFVRNVEQRMLQPRVAQAA